MKEGVGFFHLRVGDQWPSFQLAGLEIAADGGLRLQRSGSTFATRGFFLAGPLEVFAAPTPWYRLQVFGDVSDDAHVQLFTQVADMGVPPFPPADPFDPFPSSDWDVQPRDVLDVLVKRPADQPPAVEWTSSRRQLWIGGTLRGDGRSTPAIAQMRVDYGRDTYLESLPAIYGEDADRRELLERFLSLEESVLGALERTIDDLPRLFDPDAAPANGFPSWLGWLAGWLAWNVNERWTDAQARSFLAQAFALYGWRGTVEGLRRYLKVYAGVEAHIAEPGLEVGLWVLDGKAALGFTTTLAPGEAQGAVLDVSATLDRSFLTRGDRLGTALFGQLAHRFCVQVYCAELMRPGTLDAVRAVLDREKPAHTVYHLCVIEPRMRVGSQARVGIDAIVAEGPPSAHLGSALDTAVLLATAPHCGKET